MLSVIAVVLGLCGSMAAELFAEEQGRDKVRLALAEVDRWLANNQHAEAWHKRLDTHALRRELAKEEPADLVILERWLQRVTADTPAAAHSPALALRRSVEGWLARQSLPRGQHLPAVAASILSSPQGETGPRLGPEDTRTRAAERPSRAELSTHLVALAAMLSQYSERPSDNLAQSIDEELCWLDGADEASSLVEVVREYYGHPNVWIDVSKEFLDDRVARTVERTEPVSDVILGTPLSGTGRLRAQSELVIEPDSHRAVLKIVVHGQVDAQTTARRGPARIRSRSTTTFRAEKGLLIEHTKIRALPTVCRAETSTAGSDVSTASPGLLGRIVGRVAQRRWQASRDAAEQEAARHVEARVIAAVDREADELVRRVDRLVIAPMAALADRGSENTSIRFCSEPGVLRIGFCRGCLGAPPGRPPVEQGRVVAVRLHSSLINRIGSTAATRWKEPSIFTPTGAVERLVYQSARILPSLAGNSTGPVSLFEKPLWQSLAWEWLSPRLGSRGIVLRGGRWGTVTPGGLGSDWPLLGWQPAGMEPIETAGPILSFDSLR
ncbi:MAG TPA: hypothetical protein VG826_07820 [Pirellulales bacterium]|nr:hypothetical protein [Pirellulales bacterium]